MPASRVSVVVPCHDYGRFLAEAVASVDAQTRPVDELVLIDDGSTDGSAALMHEIAASRPGTVVISRRLALGAAATFTDGVRRATGDLVVILSADDRLSPRYVELLEAALADRSLSFGYCEGREFGAGSAVVTAPAFDERELRRANYVNGSAMFRRALFEELGGWRDGIRWEDWDFWVRAIGRGHRGVAVDGCWLEYRRHDNGSRDTMRPLDALGAHLRIWWLNRGNVRLADVGTWLARSVFGRVGLDRTRPAAP